MFFSFFSSYSLSFRFMSVLIRLSIRLSDYHSVYPSFQLSIRLSLFLSIYPSISQCAYLLDGEGAEVWNEAHVNEVDDG